MRYDRGMGDLSDDASDKLQALVLVDFDDVDDDHGADYCQACRAWFAALGEARPLA